MNLKVLESLCFFRRFDFGWILWYVPGRSPRQTSPAGDVGNDKTLCNRFLALGTFRYSIFGRMSGNPISWTTSFIHRKFVSIIYEILLLPRVTFRVFIFCCIIFVPCKLVLTYMYQWTCSWFEASSPIVLLPIIKLFLNCCNIFLSHISRQYHWRLRRLLPRLLWLWSPKLFGCLWRGSKGLLLSLPCWLSK